MPQSVPDDMPLSPEVERVRRKLMRLMMVTLIVTFFLVAGVLIAVIYKATQQPPKEGGHKDGGYIAATSQLPDATTYELDLDTQTRILSYSLSDTIIALETRTLEGEREFILYDYRRGGIVSRLKVSAHIE